MFNFTNNKKCKHNTFDSQMNKNKNDRTQNRVGYRKRNIFNIFLYFGSECKLDDTF